MKQMAVSATLHCLLGCSIGEVLGMILGNAFAWTNGLTVAVSIILAFLSGYTLSAVPLVKSGIAFGGALKLVLAADTLSVLTMEIIDNLIMVTVPGAMAANLTDALFWGSMVLALAGAFVVAYPVNLALLKRGKGHALTHHAHHH